MNFLINGVDYHVEVCGDGHPLVLLHGFTGAASNWKPFCPVWGAHSQLWMVDLIGHGKTDSPPEPERYGIISAANDLNTLLDEAGVERVDLLGYSMGGRLATTFACMYPHRVRKLVLESTTPGLKTESERQARKMQDQKLANTIMSEGIERFVDYWEGIPLFRTQKRLPRPVRERIRGQRLMNNPFGLSGSLLGMGTGSQPSWWGELEKLQCHTLLLTGSLDEKFSGIAGEMANLFPRSAWKIINGCGHAIHVEEPSIFGTIVSEFLSTT
ncbi:2-succinyl-6-hydroxy-2,4-cyclohexadiene-1-carboxylate synthase [Bacillus sp. T33-2]|uniref:2-succinyl-6-hydroxy-2, 4-cyclohexadiene-1-carboxylate synthase n=1 Tax=Bacillus sp. T33-2 TaxID=2054168 RepID=UPI000C774161|nr:2-succinyl-6-hydroxy-2,4-cyclohexadiene-1-carboxylate synthase [Bacillus sp. T33-2]PLR98255.1 2-succinyl-6-hydroxy-2,4-cyclohexadiene-1-carboxylate synthase [Bacillus sp. T33-2]